MALQQFVCCFTVMIIFFCCHSQQPTCGSSAVNSSSITGVCDAAPGSWPWFTAVNTFSAEQHLSSEAAVNFTDYIQPICLASENSTFNNETSSWAIGFEEFSFNLQEAKVSIVGSNECKARFPWITDRIICTRETDSCCYTSVLITFITVFPQDTLGAPLMTQSKSVWLQSGVFSLPGCTASPSVYTPVSHSLQTTAPPTAPPTAPLTVPPTTPTAPPTSLTCVGVFCSGENLIHITYSTSQ
ncbi:battenin [Sarotherodon galilaeus]